VSTLTKVLIVLLTISSIFLCGIVVTYVANADNFKQKWADGRRAVQDAEAKATAADEQHNELKDAKQQEITGLNTEIGDLKSEIITLKSELELVKDKRDQLLLDVDQITSASQANAQTHKGLHTMFDNKETELMEANAQKIKLDTQNKQITEALLQKMAIIAQLEEKTKQLVQEKSQLQAKFEQFLRQYGKTLAATTPPSLMRRDKVQVAPPPTPPITPNIKDIGLKGLITRVDLKNYMAEISIGAADGVKEDMRFHVTRGNEFICDILVLDVRAETAVGIIELMDVTKQQPKVRDNVSTNMSL